MVKKYLSLYFKVFFICEITLVAVLPLLITITTSLILNFSLNNILFLTFAFIKSNWITSLLGSTLGSLILVTVHILKVRSLPTHEPENITPIQMRELVLPVNQNEAFKSCLSSLMLINAKVIQKDEHSRIKAKTAISFSKPDTEIEFTIRPITTSRTLVRFTSKPTWKTVLVNFGASIENVEKIYWYLEEKFNLN